MLNKILVLFILSSFAILFLPKEIKFSTGSSQDYELHTISVRHPGEKKLILADLYEIRGPDEISKMFYMDVESVICLQEVCKVIPVRLFWNNLGEYQRYELQPNATLEKYEADLFVEVDYKKLNTILINKKSPFKNVRVDEILNVVTDEDDIDAYSGETILELDEEDTIPGAALTCFTLWHWANNPDIIKHIIEYTGDSFSEPKLVDTLSPNTSTAFIVIALYQLQKRQLYDSKYIHVINQVLRSRNDMIKPAIVFLENGPSEFYKKAMKTIFKNDSEVIKMSVLQSLRHNTDKYTNEYLNSFCDAASLLNSYPVVSKYLDLMESWNPNSNAIVELCLPLLESDFITARRVYWYLKSQKLNESQKGVVDDFFMKHQHRF